MRASSFAKLVAVSAVLLPASVEGQAAPRLEPCNVRGLSGDVSCGVVRVPEDRAKPNDRQIDLRVVVARATGAPRVATDAFVLLAGGPGQAGTEMGEFATQAFGKVREHRDIVLVDARGTGGSNSLRCALMRKPEDFVGSTIYPPASVRFCRDSLSKIADLTRYTTAEIADDLDVVRQSLGYRQLNLYGTSYGSRLAFVYLRRHPSSVRAVVLKAVAPPTLIAPMNYAEDAERAFALLVRDCRADTGCVSAVPSPRADLDTVLARAARGMIKTAVPNNTGRADTLVVSRDAIGGSLLTLMQSASQRAQLPSLLHQAATGNANGLASVVLLVRRTLDVAISSGMHLSVSCSDDGGRLDVAAAERNDARTFLGASRVRMLADACRTWRMPPADPQNGAPVRSNVPVLLVSGELDPNTPPRHADLALKTLPNARHVVLAGVAHGWSGVDTCGAQFVADFIARASVKDLDVSCSTTSSAPPFVTR
jgi:pimeloyl-ACP methyl ester carboxylesterase